MAAIRNGSRYFEGTLMILSKWKIKRRIGSLSNALPIVVYKTVDSTNTQAKLAAESGKYKNAVFIASEQTAGRGRLGRSFTSNKGKGIYLSILLNEKMPAAKATALTTYMAVIASEAIDNLSGIETKIKWVNDIYLNGKKLSGILTEGKGSDNGESIDYAVIGIGINLLKQDFPEDVSNIATTLEDVIGKKINANDLAARIIKDFFNELSLAGEREIADRYRKKSFLIGERVTVIKPTEEYEATVNGITDRCELVLTLKDGSEEILSTGEVSVRKI